MTRRNKISKSRVATSLVIAAVLIIESVSIYKSQDARADIYDDQINSLQAQNAVYSSQSAALASQALTLQNTLADLRAQAAVLQNEINISQAKYDQLTARIADTEKQITEEKNNLATTLASIYVDDSISPIEMLASSSNISDYLDKQEYRNSIKDGLSAAISRIQSLQDSLKKDQSDVAKVLADQKSQQDELTARTNQQDSLLSQTQGQESAYQSLISTNLSKINEARATQALINARVSGSGGYKLVDSGKMVGYPWDSSNCPMGGMYYGSYSPYVSTMGSDGNGGDGYGYGCRQCASYVAWRIAKETGKYYRWNNAVDFTANAINAGYQAGMPQAGSIAVMDPSKAGASEGHVAWVEGVSPDGTKVLVSQYNFNYGAGYGMYSEMWLSTGAFDHYVHIL